jgi:hypothetical protein
MNSDLFCLLVSKIIHSEAGPLLQQFCAKLPPLQVGDVQITPGYLLRAKCKWMK